MYDEISKCDVVIIGNGRLFVDISLDFMKGPLSYFSIIVILAKFMGKPIVLSSISLVHPETDLGKKHLKFILNNSNAVLVRENYSSSVAKSYIDNPKKIITLPDIAFALTKNESNESSIYIEKNKKYVGVNFRGLISQKIRTKMK
ncbi:polysaccharide pyruvyl transferase family protein [Shewanella dokdonensis]|uniref:Polysaccharide pyruvyl transferase family protein n=1 Tax=Shewanella dokdonensis TaxID=712036 RepID=A0ABX8DIV7_9GAMM|nr:polysaccharide pyruvyl transferase family protein [Shewanella dokdonensis]